ncbi:MAG: DUF3168 domain-containing protein [Alphaproteobacteria bacterium]|nr:DUF3168 domain-containing protein [Alphaproteobacteria bacterium]
MRGLLQFKSYFYTRLSSDADLVTLLGGAHIYDVVQESAALPYIAYEQISSQNTHQLDEQMTEHVIGLIVVARADSSLTTHNIMAQLEKLIDELPANADLTLGYEMLSAELLSTSIEQTNFEIVKGLMQVKILMTGGG